MAASPPLVELADFATWLGLAEFSGEDEPRAEAVLAAASALVREEARRTWVDAETGELTPVPDAVQVIVKEAAKRAWLNPEGYTAEGDGDYNYKLEAESAGIYLTEEEQRILGRYRQPRSGLWTLPTTRGEIPWRLDRTWYATADYGGDPIPWFSGW